MGGWVYGPDVKNKCWFWNLEFDYLGLNEVQNSIFFFKKSLFKGKIAFFAWYDSKLYREIILEHPYNEKLKHF